MDAPIGGSVTPCGIGHFAPRPGLKFKLSDTTESMWNPYSAVEDIGDKGLLPQCEGEIREGRLGLSPKCQWIKLCGCSSHSQDAL